MADEMISLFEGSEFKDLVHDLVRQAFSQLMEMEVGALTGAGLGERSEDRVNSRNGYRERPYKSRVGDFTLRIPKLRQSTYFPSFLEPRRTVEKALVSVIQEAYLQGVSTRSVDELVKALGGSGISKSEVSRLCAEVEGRVREFLERPALGSFPYVWLDATYLKVREGSRIVSKAAVIAIGLNEEGRKEVLGMRLGHAETLEFWSEFLRSLLDRGLRGVKLVVSDSHAGLKRAIEQCMGCSWQRCRCTSCAMSWPGSPRAAKTWWRASSERRLPSARRPTPGPNGKRSRRGWKSTLQPSPPSCTRRWKTFWPTARILKLSGLNWLPPTVSSGSTGRSNAGATSCRSFPTTTA